MTTRTQYEPTWYESALWDYVRRAVDGYLSGDERVYFAQQSGPRRRPPWVTIQVLSGSDLGRAEVRTLDDGTGLGADYTTTADRWRRGTATIKAAGPAARAMAEEIAARWSLPAHVYRNQAAGISIVRTLSGPLDVSSVEDSQVYRMYSVDLEFLYALRVEELGGVVDKARVVGDVDGSEVDIEVEA